MIFGVADLILKQKFTTSQYLVCVQKCLFFLLQNIYYYFYDLVLAALATRKKKFPYVKKNQLFFLQNIYYFIYLVLTTLSTYRTKNKSIILS